MTRSRVDDAHAPVSLRPEEGEHGRRAAAPQRLRQVERGPDRLLDEDAVLVHHIAVLRFDVTRARASPDEFGREASVGFDRARPQRAHLRCTARVCERRPTRTIGCLRRELGRRILLQAVTEVGRGGNRPHRGRGHTSNDAVARTEIQASRLGMPLTPTGRRSCSGAGWARSCRARLVGARPETPCRRRPTRSHRRRCRRRS